MPEYINPELIEKAARTLSDRSQHEYRGDIRTLIPSCVCGWTATEPYDVEGFDRHITETVLATVADDLRAEGAARALRDYADQLDQEAAEYAARLRVTHVLCRHCHLRYGERDQYPCVIAGTAHHYDEDELAEAAQVHVETTHDGDYARAHAIQIEARDE